MGAVQQKKDPRSRIVEAARHLFATQGFHQTPMSELAMVADVSVGLIYRLFKDKSDVIMAIIVDNSERKADDVSQILNAVRSKQVSIEQGFFQLALRALSDKEEALSFEILAEAHRNKIVGDKIGNLCANYRNAVRELACIANPKLSGSDLEGAEELLLGLMFGLGHRSLSRPHLAVHETAEQTSRMIISLLSTTS